MVSGLDFWYKDRKRWNQYQAIFEINVSENYDRLGHLNLGKACELNYLKVGNDRDHAFAS